jgi:RNA polymerase sigma-70 factor (ECF subfamily)
MGQVTLAEELAGLTSEAIFEQYRDKIYRYILSMVRDPAEAEDLTQETFLRAHLKLESLQDRAALTVWLYRIATHVCYDRFRQSSYRRAPQPLDAALDDGQAEAQWADVDAPRLDQVIEQNEMSACVQEFIEQLPDSYRVVILLHDLHGLTNPEIAQMLGHSLGAVKIRLHRARRQLKAALTAACDFSHDERGVFVCERKPPNH